jgi:hypothetical protein
LKLKDFLLKKSIGFYLTRKIPIVLFLFLKIPQN